MAEEFCKLSWAGVKREAFCPEDGTARNVILHVFHEFVAIAQCWVSRDMRRYCNADKRGAGWDELRGDSWCDQIDWYQLLLVSGWFGRCGSTRFGWSLNNASS